MKKVREKIYAVITKFLYHKVKKGYKNTLEGLKIKRQVKLSSLAAAYMEIEMNPCVEFGEDKTHCA